MLVSGNIFLHNPRGSNNKLSEQSNTRENPYRLFDSENDDKGGYQIGDNCKPACKDGNNDYDPTVPGAMQGQMRYYQGSELYIEWTNQHGCGIGHPHVICQLVLQYMCSSDNPAMRDGTARGIGNTAGGPSDPPIQVEANNASLGQHEPLQFYLDCSARDRNRGLYTADVEMNESVGATATRQQGGRTERYGLECPEERDYYPYWHPSPWHDIAVFTSEPSSRCDYYVAESENVKPRNYCSISEYNRERDCVGNGGLWKLTSARSQKPPYCAGGVQSRDNHLGNTRNGQPSYYLWKIPVEVAGTCVLRLRYNVTSGDFNAGSTVRTLDSDTSSLDYFQIDARYNDPSPSSRRRTVFAGGPPIIAADPEQDWLHLGSSDARLRLQLMSQDLGRTFQDRSHSFQVLPRPSGISDNARIVNYNVRGRRGTIVEVYPSVEYDFAPSDLQIVAGDYLHFQWTGSDANDNGNSGNGRQGTDRSNLVQIPDSMENVPIAASAQTLFDPKTADVTSLIKKLAFLDQRSNVQCDVASTSANAATNCKLLNGASAYFDAGLVQMTNVGSFHVASTRNNFFSHRQQKAMITVTPYLQPWWVILLAVLGGLLLSSLLCYSGLALYACRNPESKFFGEKYRPRILRWILTKETLERKVAQRQAWKRSMSDVQLKRDKASSHSKAIHPMPNDRDVEKATCAIETQGTSGSLASDVPISSPWETQLAMRCCQSLFRDQRSAVLVLEVLAAITFAVGAVMNLDGGFNQSAAFPLAKGAGLTLDFMFAILLLPTLKIAQTALVNRGALARFWIPIDDPIAFHIAIAINIAFFTVIHIAAHMWHTWLIAIGPRFQVDPLKKYDYTAMMQLSGMAWAQQFTQLSYATGVPLTAGLLLMYITALPCVRRGTSRCLRWCGGFKIFQRVHKIWPLIYLCLLLHGDIKIWLLLVFPFSFLLYDRIMLTGGHRYEGILLSARLLPFDVLNLTFQIPSGFAYQAGQYIMIHWNGEWHPFTLTSCPEERFLTVHIRAARSLDWCHALRRRLITEAPAASMLIAEEPSENLRDLSLLKEPAAGTEIFYEQVHRGCRAIGGEDEFNNFMSSDQAKSWATPVRTYGSEILGDVPSRPRSEHEFDTVNLMIQGPFGAPAQRVWEFNTVMAVGAGIGVTPFVSILRSVQARAQQRATLQAAAETCSNAATGAPTSAKVFGVSRRSQRTSFCNVEGSTPGPTLLGAFQAEVTSRNSVREKNSPVSHPGKNIRSASKPVASAFTARAALSVEELLTDVLPIPASIHFYWIVRSQEELNWFYSLLQAAMDGPARGIIEVNLFTTGEVELSRVHDYSCVHHQYFGRPSWGRIFKSVKKQHAGEHVGVFLCGSPAIASQLSALSERHSDKEDEANGTMFSFFKENF